MIAILIARLVRSRPVPRTLPACVKWNVDSKCGGKLGDLPRCPEFLAD